MEQENLVEKENKEVRLVKEDSSKSFTHQRPAPSTKPPTQRARSSQKFESVKITTETIRKYICPTATDQELFMFSEKCRINGLNPFAGEAYLVKYDKSPAQMIISEGGLNKKIQSIPGLISISDGIIIEDEKGEVHEVVGEFYSSKQKLVGAWARVEIGGKAPYYVKVRLEDYDKDKSTWKSIKARMITKVARVHCIRRSIPGLQGIYIEAEIGAIEPNDSVQNKKDVSEPQSLSAPKQNETDKFGQDTGPEQSEMVNSVLEMISKIANGSKDVALKILETSSEYESNGTKIPGVQNLVGVSDNRLFYIHKKVVEMFKQWESENA